MGLPFIRGLRLLAGLALAYNIMCDDCIHERIEESDDSLGGSRPFEG